MIIDHIQNYLSKDKLELFTEIVNSVYNDGVKEYCFNGQLTNKDYSQELLIILKELKKVAMEKLESTDTLNKISKKWYIVLEGMWLKCILKLTILMELTVIL